ncbi:MAG: oxygenase MpaB family protein [Acidimicrobiales bacterium]
MSYPGDPGILGPGSVSWEVIGDVTAFVGGIRALVVQTAHPEVVAGVDKHSQYRTDPLGRLSRTSVYVTETTYGAMPEVDKAVAAVRKAHVPVRGVSERRQPYSAGQPALAAWVHNVLTESFLVAFQTYGPRNLSRLEADRFVAEQARIGILLGGDPLPLSADELSHWISHHPDLAPTAAQVRAVDFLRNPPLPVAVKFGYRLLFGAALATLPANISAITGLGPRRGGEAAGRRTVDALRWALGSSPSWHLALVRSGAPVPSGRFRQPLPESVRTTGDQNS